MSKYGNIKCEYEGIKFDSKAERKRYITLLLWQQSGVISDLQLQVKYVLTASKKRDDNITRVTFQYT